MADVIVDDVAVDGSRLRCSLECTGRVRRFFTGADLQVDYGRDVSTVPDRILTIPVLAQVCPVAWAAAATVYVPAVDEQFLASLETVHDVVVEMYPSFVGERHLEADSVVADDAPPGSESALLFTGGVDSMASFLNNRDDDPQLVTIQGWVFRNTQPGAWQNLRDYVEDFADAVGVRANFVESNLHSFLNPGMLDAHYRRYLEGTWYAAVGHGLGLLGLCAPLTWASDVGRLAIAATYHEGLDFEESWGSHPDVDGNVEWTGTRCRHDGYDVSRQDKVDAIVEFARESSHDVAIQVCNERVENCGRCAKCLRTITGLLAAGADPGRFGYDLDEETVALARECFADQSFHRDEDDWVWSEMGDAIDAREDIDAGGPAGAELRQLVSSTDFQARMVENEPALRDRLWYAILRNTPYGLYSSLSSLLSGSTRRLPAADPTN